MFHLHTPAVCPQRVPWQQRITLLCALGGSNHYHYCNQDWTGGSIICSGCFTITKIQPFVSIGWAYSGPPQWFISELFEWYGQYLLIWLCWDFGFYTRACLGLNGPPFDIFCETTFAFLPCLWSVYLGIGYCFVSCLVSYSSLRGLVIVMGEWSNLHLFDSVVCLAVCCDGVVVIGYLGCCFEFMISVMFVGVVWSGIGHVSLVVPMAFRQAGVNLEYSKKGGAGTMWWVGICRWYVWTGRD